MKSSSSDNILSNQNIMLTIGKNNDKSKGYQNLNELITRQPPQVGPKIGIREKPKFLTLGTKNISGSKEKLTKSRTTHRISAESMITHNTMAQKRISYQFFERFTGRRISQSEYYDSGSKKNNQETEEVYYATEKIDNVQR